MPVTPVLGISDNADELFTCCGQLQMLRRSRDREVLLCLAECEQNPYGINCPHDREQDHAGQE
jgi:hypothetical protein